MSDESALLQELRDLAGVKRGDTFYVEHAGTKIEVKYSGGSSSSLTLSAHYDTVAKGEGAGEIAGSYRQRARTIGVFATRPMMITLRRERPADVAAKISGINVEHQTGDPTFDDSVYIDSPTTSTEVLNGVLTEQVRTAVRALLFLGFGSVDIDDRAGMVSARLTEFSSARAVDGRGPKIVEAFANLCNGLPKVTRSAAQHAPKPLPVFGWAVGVLAVTFFFAMLPVLSFIGGAIGCIDPSSDSDSITFKSECGAPFMSGFVMGVLMSIAGGIGTNRIITPILRGRSDSASRIGLISVGTGILIGEITFFAICVAEMIHR